MHPLLTRLLRRVGATVDAPPSQDAWQSLLAVVSRTYHDADQDRYTLERSIDISSRELQGLYQDLKRASERQLEESDAIISATLESVNAGVIVVDRDRKLLKVNQCFHEIFDIPEGLRSSSDHGQLVTATLAQFPDPEAAALRIRAIHASKVVHQDEIRLLNGRIVERYSAPIKLPDSAEIVGRVTFFRDVTDERAMTQQLEHAREAAESASAAKTMFLASMSHELRTPLNAVLGLAELLLVEGESITPRQSEYVDGIIDAGRHLLALVNDVLDLAKVEAGKQDFHPEPVDACAAIEEAVSMLSPLADRRGVKLEAEVPASASMLMADPLRLRQILYNLISNAVKFTDRDRSVRVSAAHTDAGIAIAVSDQGVGIADADLGRLFRAFEQIEQPTGERPPGTGLGLALTKRLVDMHGGSMDVDSHVGIGTTFTVRIPHEPRPHE